MLVLWPVPNILLVMSKNIFVSPLNQQIPMVSQSARVPVRILTMLPCMNYISGKQVVRIRRLLGIDFLSGHLPMPSEPEWEP